LVKSSSSIVILQSYFSVALSVLLSMWERQLKGLYHIMHASLF